MTTPSPTPPSLDELSSTLAQILQNQQGFQNNIANLTAELHGLRTCIGPPGFPFQPHKITPFLNTPIKLDIPRFDGTDPLGWIFKINQFFYFHSTPEDQRLRIAFFTWTTVL